MVVREENECSVGYMQLKYPKYQTERGEGHTNHMETRAMFNLYATYFAQVIMIVTTERAIHGDYLFSKKAQIQLRFPRVCLH